MASERTASFILKLVDMVSGPLNKISNFAGGVINKMDALGGSLTRMGKTALFLTSLNTAITGTAEALNTATAPGERFQSQMAEMQAITGITGDGLDQLGLKARKTALIFGGNAADGVEVYKNILSKLDPELAKNPEAMARMGNAVGLMSKTMNGDAVGAVEALTTSMNQYGVSLKDPIAASNSMARMMDIISNGAQVGSAEVPQIAESIKVAGLSAKNAKLSFEELNASIQIMGKGSVYGAEAGTALRNVLALMGRGNFTPKAAREEMQALGVDINKIADTTIPFAERLKEISKIQGDSALVTKVFGMENKNAAMLLMQNIPQYEKWTEAVGKSGTTLEMANAIMGTHEEKMKRIMAKISDVGISVFNTTKSFLPFISVMIMGIAYATQLGPGLALISSGLGKVMLGFKGAALTGMGYLKTLALTGFTALVTAGQFIFAATAGLGSFILATASATLSMLGLNVVLYANPIGLFILGLLAVGAAVAAVIYWWDDLKVYMLNAAIFFMKLNPFYWLVELIEFVFPGFKAAISDFFGKVWEKIKVFWDKIKGAWDWIKGMFTDSGIEDMNATVNVGTDIKYDDSGLNFEKDVNTINKADRKTSVEGDSNQSRIVNLRIDKIEINAKVDNSSNSSMENLGDDIARVVVSAFRDTEIILSNG